MRTTPLLSVCQSPSGVSASSSCRVLTTGGFSSAGGEGAASIGRGTGGSGGNGGGRADWVETAAVANPTAGVDAGGGVTAGGGGGAAAMMDFVGAGGVDGGETWAGAGAGAGDGGGGGAALRWS